MSDNQTIGKAVIARAKGNVCSGFSSPNAGAKLLQIGPIGRRLRQNFVRRRDHLRTRLGSLPSRGRL
eukprot:scaffold322885_cov19-Prasinocladus_malaysianus.AAC.1